MTVEEKHALLLRAQYGHLGCTRDGHPYVVPMHYAFDDQDIYFFTTKSRLIVKGAETCLRCGEGC